MTRHPPQRSKIVAFWLFCVAALILAMVMVGGATRLTDSGLSITEWKPILGALPPLSEQDWHEVFAKYKTIPQYHQLNSGMSLEAFKQIFWWEWGHRLLGRVIGAVFFIPLVVLFLFKQIPTRLVWRCVGIFALGGVQGAIGWWMVASGLVDRIDVAPERLATHLIVALLILVLCVWTGLEAWFGPGRGPAARGITPLAQTLLGLVFVQCLLGAFVAGNDAGLVYNDWPLMNGDLVPGVDYHKGVGFALVHDQGLVQFNHRLGAYLLVILTLGLTLWIQRSRGLYAAKPLSLGVLFLVLCQAGLGIATLMMQVPLGLGVMHQGLAVLVLSLVTVLNWRLLRSDRPL